MDVQIMEITPIIAQRIMNGNTDNFRKIDCNRVHLYANAMKNGLWQENGEPIQIYKDGTLANGQHRLSAIIESGVSLKFVVVLNVDKSVTTFDRGKNRTPCQIAKARGYDLTSQEIGAIGILYAGLGAKKYEDNSLFEFYGKLPGFDSVGDIMKKGSSHPITLKSGAIAAAYSAFVLGNIQTKQLETFAYIVNTGLPIKDENSLPPLCLRKTYQRYVKGSNGSLITRGEAIRRVHFETTYKALCDFANNRERQVTYSMDGSGDKIIESVRKTLKIA